MGDANRERKLASMFHMSQHSLANGDVHQLHFENERVLNSGRPAENSDAKAFESWLRWLGGRIQNIAVETNR